MGELKTVKLDSVHQELLDNISDSYQKTEGFPTWDLLRAAAFGIKEAWDKALEVEWKQDVDNLSGSDLDKLVYQRTGLERNQAVKAVGEITVTGKGYIIAGDLFETSDGIQFKATESKSVETDDTVAIEAVIGGADGNVAADTITLMPVTIAGISKVTNEAELSGGYNTESDDDYRERYYDYLRTPATCGNKYHYLQWAKAVDGVGKARCIPCWQGKNTVKVIVVGNDDKPASDSLVASVQDYIDPNKEGKGLGQAPIGAVCTVVKATAVTINVSFGLSLSTGVSVADVQNAVKDSIDAYIKSTVFEKSYVSYAKVGAAILDVAGVEDYSNLRLNDAQNSIEIAFAECPVLGVVTINE